MNGLKIKQNFTHRLVLSNAPGSLERMMCNLRRRKYEILNMNIKKENNQYLIDMELRGDRPEKLEPLLSRLWDVRTCQNLAKKTSES